MPRILTPRRDLPQHSRRRTSITSLPGSRSSLNSYGSSPYTYGRRSSLDNPGSQYSLKRTSSALKRTKSSMHSLSQRGMLHHKQTQKSSPLSSMVNEVWNIEAYDSQGPPSMVSSETSSLSSQDCQQPPSAARLSLHQYYAAQRRASLQPQSSTTPESPAAAQERRSSLQHPKSGFSFLPQGQIKEEEWGQFVDTQDSVDEDDLARRCSLLSVGKNNMIQGPYRLRR